MIDGIEDDPLGLVSSQTLKWSLNLISNGTMMIMMGKVLSNRMIDVRTSNNKLIDQCVRNLYEELPKRHVFAALDRKALYDHVIKVHRKNQKAAAQGVYTPSPFKIVLMMLMRGLTYEAAIEHLLVIKENVAMIF